MLYINNKDGTFSDKILERMNHISFNSMGSDYDDINNDRLLDLLVLEMAAEDHVRSKENMPSMDVQNFNEMVEVNYHYQYMVNTFQLNNKRGQYSEIAQLAGIAKTVNTFQLNNKRGQYSEIAQLAGIAKTDWSWASLIIDFDNDGLKDVFITDGIFKELDNQDYKNILLKKFSKENHSIFDEVVNNFPSSKLSNYSFKNNGNLSFTNTSVQWGFNDTRTQSNGATYADFDNEGDLDLVINNINDRAQAYRNNDTHNFIQLWLTRNKENPFAIGAKITIATGNKKQYQELYTSRGYLSSVHPVINFGVNTSTKIDEILIEWPNEKVTKMTNVKVNQIILVDQETATEQISEENKKEQLLTEICPGKKDIQHKHRENEFDDFKNQILLPHSQSTNGPFIGSADANNDGLDDFFVGAATGQSAELYVQSTDGIFNRQVSKVWLDDREYEDLGVLFFDADGDADMDLYVVSGGSEFEPQSGMFQDRLYLNDGNGNFTKNSNRLPKITSSGQCIKVSDIDNDGDLDLFIGGRVIPDKYPYPPDSYILINENARSQNQTKEVAPQIANAGMVTDAIFSDYDNDGDQDLIVVGEWMPITIFKNLGERFEIESSEYLKNTEGICFSIESNDIDNDGDQDYFVGNLGLNSKFKASKGKLFHIFCDDFDGSGTYGIVRTNSYKGDLVPFRGRECSSQQVPFIKDKFPTFASFAKTNIQDIYGAEALKEALHLTIKKLESIFLENLGDGNFNIVKLPNLVQASPIMDFDFLDINNDGLSEIIAVGNHYNSEVETTRYDAFYGAILSYNNGKISVDHSVNTDFFTEGNAKDIIIIDSQGAKQVIITNNNNRLNIFSTKYNAKGDCGIKLRIHHNML